MQNPLISQLDLVEQQFRQVAALLAQADAPNVQTASAALQSLSVEFSRLLQSANTSRVSLTAQKSLRRRLVPLAAGMQMLRDNLSRQAALNQMALNVLVPAPAKSTYSGGSSVYGTVARQGGVQRFLAA
jgi:hypothetical protein